MAQAQTLAFDPQAFIAATVEKPLDEVYRVCPEGEYPAMIDTFNEYTFGSIDFDYKKGERAGQKGHMDFFNVPFVIQDPTVQASLGRDKVVVPAKCIIDWRDNIRGGPIDDGPGKNILLGQIKGAVGQNQPGVPHSSLQGAGPVIVKVTHRPDEKNPEKKYAEVTRVSAIK